MSEKIKTAVMEIIKAYMVGEDKNTKAVLSDVMESVNELETHEMVHVETLYQVMWERDIAISQLKELGYEFGQKIEPCDDAVSREPCRTCKYGEIYNDAWCRCTHYRISGCRVRIKDGCEVERDYGEKVGAE